MGFCPLCIQSHWPFIHFFSPVHWSFPLSVLPTHREELVANFKLRGTGVCFQLQHIQVYTLLSQRPLQWLGHVPRIANGGIPKDMLYGELVTGTPTAGRPYLRYRDTCKRAMKVAGIDTKIWEAAADDRGHWRSVVKAGMRRREENRSEREAAKREKRKQKSSHPPQPTIYICHKCGRDCHAGVGLISYSRKC